MLTLALGERIRWLAVWFRSWRRGTWCGSAHYHWQSNTTTHKCCRAKGHPGTHRSIYEWK